MEIRISEKEITAGVVAYLNSRGFNLDPNTIKVDYTQGRKPAGLSAVLVEAGFEDEAGPEPEHGPAAIVEAKGDQVLTSQAVTGAVVGKADKAPEVKAEAKPEVVAEDPASAEANVEVGVLAAEGDAAAAPTTSLFQ